MRINFLFFIPFFLLVSCAPNFHIFNSTNAPCINEKGQTNANLFAGLDHGEAQLAFSPLNHLGIMSNSYWTSKSSLSYGTNLIEGAIGTYFDLGEDWNIDFYGGAGYGERAYKADPSSKLPLTYLKLNTYDIQTYYSKYFLQSSVFLKDENLEYSFSLQTTVFNFDNVHFYEEMASSNQNPLGKTFNYNFNNKNAINFNTAFTLKYGFRNLKFIAQVANNFRLYNPFFSELRVDAQIPFNRRYIELNVGVQLALTFRRKSER